MSDTPEYLKEGDGYIDVTLAKPATINGASVGVIRMREPTAGDMETGQKRGKTPAEQEVETFANLCEIAPSDVRTLAFRNYRRLQEAFTVFIS